MPFKYDAEGRIVTQDVSGQKLPVFVYPDGKETPFDGDGTIGTISRLNGEAKSHRERAETAEARAKLFEGIEDADAARKALETVKNIKDGELITAGKVEEIKAAAKRAAEETVAAANKASAAELEKLRGERDGLQTQLYDEKIGGSFDRSKFIAEKLAIPGDMAKAAFGKAFRIEDGKVVAYDASGNKVFSRVRPGDVANFDEALETLVENYPYRDQILKGSGASGGGASGGGAAGGKKSYSRAEFNTFDPAKQAQVAAEVRTGKATLND
ncbi:hypothetical protein KDW54_06765 [Burkholderia ambifaria]|uniref:DUF6651 domain-containing protein n=1 Tax=Burkholderia ambifaria TaxID=152480 RepID=UPI001B998358|nr:DUF6651 domain-containing protein [Burkholderia ambifaria]MBR8182100.1 hypothetical protein [Burkholderia ambifaria]